MSSEHLILHALPTALSPILINLAWKYFLEVGKHFHHAEEETSLKTHHAPPPGMKGACGRSRAEPLPSAHVPRWANVLQTSHPLHTLGQLPHPQSSTARATQSGHLWVVSTHVLFRGSVLKAVLLVTFVFFLSIFLKKIELCSR